MLRNATVQEEAGARVAQAVPGDKGKRPFQVVIKVCLGGCVPGGSGEGVEQGEAAERSGWRRDDTGSVALTFLTLICFHCQGVAFKVVVGG